MYLKNLKISKEQNYDRNVKKLFAKIFPNENSAFLIHPLRMTAKTEFLSKIQYLYSFNHLMDSVKHCELQCSW